MAKNRVTAHYAPRHDPPAVRGAPVERREPARRDQDWALQQGQAWLKTAGNWIAEHPTASLGIALAVGVTLGWLVKRR